MQGREHWLASFMTRSNPFKFPRFPKRIFLQLTKNRSCNGTAFIGFSSKVQGEIRPFGKALEQKLVLQGNQPDFNWVNFSEEAQDKGTRRAASRSYQLQSCRQCLLTSLLDGPRAEGQAIFHYWTQERLEDVKTCSWIKSTPIQPIFLKI